MSTSSSSSSTTSLHKHGMQQAACVILLRPKVQKNLGDADRSDYDVYIAQRSDSMAVMAGYYVFPGGSCHPSDAIIYQQQHLPSPLHSTAVRELFEETGLLLCHRGEDLSQNHRYLLRRSLGCTPQPRNLTQNLKPYVPQKEDPQNTWDKLLQTYQLRLDVEQLHFAGRYQTPPFGHRSYDTQYFLHVVAAPTNINNDDLSSEFSNGCWLSPEKTLQLHQQGNIYLAYPVYLTLQILAAHPKLTMLQQAIETLQAIVPETLPAQYPILPGVELLPVLAATLPPATHTNCYVLGDEEMILVDPGCHDEQIIAQLMAYIDSQIQKGRRLQQIWITHEHTDHTAACLALHQRYNVGIWAHLQSQKLLEDSMPFAGELTAGLYQPLADRNGGKRHWQVIETPGHSMGHVCFYCPEYGQLLTGDSVLGYGTTLVPPHPHGDMSAYMQSLELLLSYKPKILLPGHGPPLATGSQQILFYQRHRQKREQQLLAILNQPQSLDRLRQALYPQLDPSIGHLAMLNIRSHLEKLEKEHRVVCIDHLYQVVP